MRIFFSLIILFAHQALVAQFTSNSWSELIEPGEASSVQGIYSNGEIQATLFTDGEKKSNHVSIAVIDHSNKVQLYQHKFEQHGAHVAGVYLKSTGVVLIGSRVHGKDGNFVQEVFALDFTDGAKKQEQIISRFSLKNLQHAGKVKLTQSPSFNKTLVFIESPFAMGNKEEIKFLVYDKNGNEELNKTMPLDIDSKQNPHNYPQIANNGTIYFLKKDKEKNIHRYFLYAYNPSINTLTHKLISLPNAHITEIRGTVTRENEFLVGGFTASEPVHAYEGYYLFKFDGNCSQKFKTQGQFDESTFLKFLNKKEYSKDPSIKNYYLDHIIQLSSGKIFMAAEAYTEESISKQANIPYYNDIMLISFDEKGAYKTAYRHKKTQSAEGINASWVSYKYFSQKDTLYLIHNNLANTEGSKQKEPVVQFVAAHEKFGTQTRHPKGFTHDNQASFYLPQSPVLPMENGFLTLFSNMSQNAFKVCYFRYTE